jgi:hypothetical protein
VAKDAAISGALGVGGQAFGEGLGAASRPLTKALRGQSDEAAKVALDAAQRAEDRAAQSAVGAVGGRTSGVANTMDGLMEIARNELGLYSPEEVASALARLKEPDMAALRQQMARNLIVKAGNQGPQLEKAREEMVQAFARAEPEAVAASVAPKLTLEGASKDVAKKLWKTLAPRAALGVVGSGIGAGYSALTGGDVSQGAKWGGGVGAVFPPGVVQVLRNTAADPAKQAVINAVAAKGAAAAGNMASKYGQGAGALAGRGTTELTNEERRRVEAYLATLRGTPTP